MGRISHLKIDIGEIMKAIAVIPGKQDSVHLTELPAPTADDVPNGRGVLVTAFALAPKPNLNAELIEAIGARYETTKDLPILQGAEKYGPFDLIFEATGFSPVVFESMQALGKNGVLVLSSVTGGDRVIEAPADKINLEFVLGNKVMVGTVNANREYFEMGVKDMAQSEAEYPGWLKQLLTHPVKGLESYEELFEKLTTERGAIKVFCEVAEFVG
jgi:threonine dehydrogenase-like Zn-dependent dehydrogenase